MSLPEKVVNVVSDSDGDIRALAIGAAAIEGHGVHPSNVVDAVCRRLPPRGR